MTKTTAHDLLYMTLEVSRLERQDRPWQTGGLFPRHFGPGWFVHLDPKVGQLASDHEGLGLILHRAGFPRRLHHQTGEVREDGRIVLFFEHSAPVAVGDEVGFVSAHCWFVRCPAGPPDLGRLPKFLWDTEVLWDTEPTSTPEWTQLIGVRRSDSDRVSVHANLPDRAVLSVSSGYIDLAARAAWYVATAAGAGAGVGSRPEGPFDEFDELANEMGVFDPRVAWERVRGR